MEEIKLQTSKHKWKHIKQIKIQSVNLNEENQATIKLVASTKNKQKKISNKQTNKQTNKKDEYVLNKIKIHCAILKGGNQDAVAGAVICMYREEVSLQTN